MRGELVQDYVIAWGASTKCLARNVRDYITDGIDEQNNWYIYGDPFWNTETDEVCSGWNQCLVRYKVSQ